jgi:hypothetical protein
MKNVMIAAVLMFLIASCTTKTTKFPVSTVTPAAIISASIKQDKSNNFTISVTAEHLASAERLTPPKKTYVVWIETKDKVMMNIGQLKAKNDKKATLETLTPFEPAVIIISAEDEGTVSHLSGIEISRTNIIW